MSEPDKHVQAELFKGLAAVLQEGEPLRLALLVNALLLQFQGAAKVLGERAANLPPGEERQFNLGGAEYSRICAEQISVVCGKTAASIFSARLPEFPEIAQVLETLTKPPPTPEPRPLKPIPPDDRPN